MTVLMGEHKSAADYGHAWDQLGENGEVLGRATQTPLSLIVVEEFSEYLPLSDRPKFATNC